MLLLPACPPAAVLDWQEEGLLETLDTLHSAGVIQFCLGVLVTGMPAAAVAKSRPGLLDTLDTLHSAGALCRWRMLKRHT